MDKEATGEFILTTEPSTNEISHCFDSTEAHICYKGRKMLQWWGFGSHRQLLNFHKVIYFSFARTKRCSDRDLGNTDDYLGNDLIWHGSKPCSSLVNEKRVSSVSKQSADTAQQILLIPSTDLIAQVKDSHSAARTSFRPVPTAGVRSCGILVAPPSLTTHSSAIFAAASVAVLLSRISFSISAFGSLILRRMVPSLPSSASTAAVVVFPVTKMSDMVRRVSMRLSSRSLALRCIDPDQALRGARWSGTRGSSTRK
ncbi:hypothetical protein MUK42_34510 [Musa troglodytarum]|uniref:Uncharacterized protein n=1 Tax=Musa troglodytarum TaxID=320322 RepID=A0A9E7G7C7_9LILI|nr:hypothetical protein MUK42_34510 [Musa troglodytarum]